MPLSLKKIEKTEMNLAMVCQENQTNQARTILYQSRKLYLLYCRANKLKKNIEKTA